MMIGFIFTGQHQYVFYAMCPYFDCDRQCAITDLNITKHAKPHRQNCSCNCPLKQ
jgi:hypothetical protein